MREILHKTCREIFLQEKMINSCLKKALQCEHFLEENKL